MSAIPARIDSFCRRFGLELPILLAPMAGASAPALSIAVMHAGGLGACGALLMQPDEIAAWADEVRAKGNGPYQLNLWIPDPPPTRDASHERLLRAFLSDWGPPPAEDAGDARPPDFAAQCEALLSANPPIVSSVMGVFPSEFVARLSGGGCGRGAGGRDRRDRRRTWSCRGADARRERGADRICIPALPRGGRPPCVGRSAGLRCARGHDRHQCVQRPCRAKRCDRLRAGSDRR
jgi:nitronate monooxygenase